MQSFILSLTLFRILAAPLIFILAILFQSYWIAFWLFNIAALTDYFDGKLARKFNFESKLGSILDPIGDKLLLLFAIITVMVFTQDVYVAFIGAFILAREFWVSALREFTSSNNISNLTSVTFIAKLKTTAQFISIGMYFFGQASNIAIISFLANFMLLLSLLLAYKSAFEYSQKLITPQKKSKE